MVDMVTLLIIDSRAEDRETYKRILTAGKRGDYRFLESDTGRQGLDLFDRHKVDCVLVDDVLPDMSGIDLLNAVSRKSGSQVAVIFLTGRDDETVAVQAIQSGASDCLIKDSLSASLLSRTVQYAVERKNAARRIQDHAAFLSTLMNTIPNPIFHLTRQTTFAGCNRAFEEFTGLDRDAIIDKTVHDLFPRTFFPLAMAIQSNT